MRILHRGLIVRRRTRGPDIADSAFDPTLTDFRSRFRGLTDPLREAGKGERPGHRTRRPWGSESRRRRHLLASGVAATLCEDGADERNSTGFHPAA